MRRPSVEDLFDLKAVSSPRLSRRGGEALFSVGSSFKQPHEGFKSAVFSLDLNTGTLSRLTPGEYNDEAAAPSPDGGQVAYISERPLSQGGGHTKGSSLFVVDRKPPSTTWRAEVEGKVLNYEWVGAHTIMLSALDAGGGGKAEASSIQHDEEVFEENPSFASLWTLDTQTGASSRLTHGVQIWEFSAAAAGLGGPVAVVCSDLPFERCWYGAKLGIVDPRSGEIRRVFDPGYRQLGAPRMSPGGKHVLFTCSLWSDRNSQFGDLYLYSVETGVVSNLTEDSDYSVSWAEWVGDEAAYFVANRLDEAVFFEVRAPEWVPREIRRVKLTLNPQSYPTFDVLPAAGGHLFVFSANYTGQPSELWLLDPQSGARKLTDINTHIAQQLETPDFRMVEWTNSRGEKITGYLEEYRRNDDAAAPLVVSVHGGPTSSVKPSYTNYSTTIAAKGYTVFYPNYTGSTGRGRRFAEANRGDMGGQDLQDILEGVRAVTQARRVDPSRIYIMGGSYGGYMTMWALTQSDIFAAGAALFGVSDWVSFHGTSNLSDWDTTHYGESPYDFRLYDHFSPIRHAKKISAPLLLLHGREDPYVPVGQSIQLYRALRDLGKKTRLVIYPREGHGFREKLHYTDSYTRILSWFEENTKNQ